MVFSLPDMDPAAAQQYEYIVVGSGAGGGTLAARLAEKGRRVILLEAGGDARELEGGDPLNPGLQRLPDDYDVPAFHSLASENDALSWSFFVGHQSDRSLDRLDPEVHGAAWRSRGGRHFLPPCRHARWMHGAQRDDLRLPAQCRLGPHCLVDGRLDVVGVVDATVFRASGELPSSADLPLAVAPGHQPDAARLERLVAGRDRSSDRGAHRSSSAPGRHRGGAGGGPRCTELLAAHPLVPARRLRSERLAPGPRQCAGIRYLPLTTDHRRRFGTRERLLDVAKRFPGLLTISLDTLATRVLLRRQPPRVCGRGPEGGAVISRACRAESRAWRTGTVYASREVILCGGAFNSPQLLMLSGIGRPEVLREHEIPTRVALPGVGRNLQDRYEVSVVSQMDFPEWDIFKGATFRSGDAAYVKWRTRRAGSVCDQRIGAHGVHTVDAGRSAAGPVLHGAGGALRRLQARVFGDASVRTGIF